MIHKCKSWQKKEDVIYVFSYFFEFTLIKVRDMTHEHVSLFDVKYMTHIFTYC